MTWLDRINDIDDEGVSSNAAPGVDHLSTLIRQTITPLGNGQDDAPQIAAALATGPVDLVPGAEYAWKSFRALPKLVRLNGNGASIWSRLPTLDGVTNSTLYMAASYDTPLVALSASLAVNGTSLTVESATGFVASSAGSEKWLIITTAASYYVRVYRVESVVGTTITVDEPFDAALLNQMTPVTATGGAPTITLTGTPAGNYTKIRVKCTSIAGGAARGNWAGKYTIDGSDPATSGTATSFTSAATVVVTGTNITLNIAVGNAAVGNEWTAQRDAQACMITPTKGYVRDLFIRGSGDRAIEAQLCVGMEIKNVHLKSEPTAEGTGFTGFVGSFDLGGRDNVLIDSTIDGGGVSIYGWARESNVRAHLLNVKVKNIVAGSGAADYTYQCYRCNSIGFGVTKCYTAIACDLAAAVGGGQYFGNNGCTWDHVTGTSQGGPSILVQDGAQRCTFSHVRLYSPTGNGIQIVAGSTGFATRDITIDDCTIVSGAASGINVGQNVLRARIHRFTGDSIAQSAIWDDGIATEMTSVRTRECGKGVGSGNSSSIYVSALASGATRVTDWDDEKAWGSDIIGYGIDYAPSGTTDTLYLTRFKGKYTAPAAVNARMAIFHEDKSSVVLHDCEIDHASTNLYGCYWGNHANGTVRRSGKIDFDTFVGTPFQVTGYTSAPGSTTTGTVTLNGTTAVVIAWPRLTYQDVISFRLKTAGGTLGVPYVFSKTPGTGFQVKSTNAADTSVYELTISAGG